MLPASFSRLASGESSRALMTIGAQVRPRVWVMNSVCVPLPAPGAPPSRMISLGKRRFSRPKSASMSCQTDPKISWAPLISRSVNFPATGMGATATGFGGLAVGVVIPVERAQSLDRFWSGLDTRSRGRKNTPAAVQFAAVAKTPSSILHGLRGVALADKICERGKSLEFNGSGWTPAGWHDCSETNEYDPPARCLLHPWLGDVRADQP